MKTKLYLVRPVIGSGSEKPMFLLAPRVSGDKESGRGWPSLLITEVLPCWS